MEYDFAGFPFFEIWEETPYRLAWHLHFNKTVLKKAKEILRTFAAHENGLMPNLFPEGTGTYVYTVDAALLFINWK